MRIFRIGAFFLIAIICVSSLFAQNGLQNADLFKIHAVGGVAFAPDGLHLAYTVGSNPETGRPYSQIWIMNTADAKTSRMGGENDRSGDPVWSPDGKSIAYSGSSGNKGGLWIARADGSNPRFIHELEGTNSPLPSTGNDIAWSPDSKQVAFVSALPGPETKDATGDPVVITRYLYKPDYSEGYTRFNDNRRLHIFVADVATGAIRQLTSGDHYEHSIDWSPNGQELLFVSNREPNEDQFFNYDIFALKLSDGSIRRLTATENAEYSPLWSPDGTRILYLGTRRGLTDLETTMEDTHVWIMDADGRNRRELGADIDNRQGSHAWAPDGKSVLFTVRERGSNKLYRLPVNGGQPEVLIGDRGSVVSFSVARDGKIAYSFLSPSEPSALFLKADGKARKMTDLNADLLRGKQLGEVEDFTFVSNDNKYEVEAFLTKPVGWKPEGKYPLIVVIHGGPHGQQGPGFDHKNQVYAARGWATLMVNYRGSIGYGQKFADAVFGDQNGNEAQDVIYALSAAMRRNLWIDRDRLGVEGISYGGQLSAWLITQTNIFKAAIPAAAIINLVSYNYMTYYNQYEQMEFGIFPHQGNLMDTLWERSALKHVAKVHTPTMLLHGENDNDVPIAEAEQFYVALKDVGVEAVMVRYPREGHGFREPRHVVDSIDRSIAWYEKHFPR
ncbi:MAG TPA: S9 family peptidase [Candidatus Saccharimonadales bacterium]|nr:S9 family peptidase [Candidatus Saccharimonadales bacterium]